MTDAASPRETIRLDKWLWHARFFKARTGATGLVLEGKVRVNSDRVTKPARAVGHGDVLTFPQAEVIRVVRILACGTRRGPAPEAQALYEDLTPVVAKDEIAPNPRFEGKGRPGKTERRNMQSQGISGKSSPLE